jgi:hypothetical protein
MSQQLLSPGGGCRRPSLARAFRYAGPAVSVAGSTSTRCFIFSDQTREEEEEEEGWVVEAAVLPCSLATQCERPEQGDIATQATAMSPAFCADR